MDSAIEVVTDGAVIRPGTVFRDDRGRVAQLHGIGIQRVGETWYAWGEDKAAGGTFTAVACYSSPDLVTWRFEGNSLSIGDGDLAAERVIERPKALRRPDGAWVMLLHVETADYSYARVGYAISDTPAGPYRYLHSERPMGNISRDIGVYQENGVGYLLSEDRDNGLHIYRLRPDYLGVESIVATLRQQARPEIGYESPTLVRHEGLYYLFGSDLTGWSTNDNMYATAPSLEGPWSPWRPFAPERSATFDSQVSVVVPVGTGHLYIGDRWQKDALDTSPAVWLPISLADGAATLEWHDAWNPEDAFG
ncbi:MAG: family 43 glycosylhydrolase [Microbacterium sp.]|uniref:family 43 glycosylhydrolase n=1 Tax=Microbacterium sp. TaxID=51671 RepID=UPI003BB03E7C